MLDAVEQGVPGLKVFLVRGVFQFVGLMQGRVGGRPSVGGLVGLRLDLHQDFFFFLIFVFLRGIRDLRAWRRPSLLEKLAV